MVLFGSAPGVGSGGGITSFCYFTHVNVARLTCAARLAPAKQQRQRRSAPQNFIPFPREKARTLMVRLGELAPRSAQILPKNARHRYRERNIDRPNRRGRRGECPHEPLRGAARIWPGDENRCLAPPPITRRRLQQRRCRP